MRIALAQSDLLIADIDGALAAIRSAAVAAVAQGAHLLVCPELAAFGGYPPRDLLERRWLVEQQWAGLQQLAAELPLPALVGCAEPLEPGAGPPLANSIAVIDGGRIVATYRKRLLPTYDVFDETRYFRPGDGPLVVTVAGKRIGLTVCEDIWTDDFSGVRYHCDPVGELAGQCDLLVNVSASPYHAGKPDARARLVERTAHRVRCPVVYCSQVGAHDDLLFDGDSLVVGPDGTWYCDAPRWKPGLFIADLAVPVAKPPATDPIADLWTAIVCGIAGYCRKTRQHGVVLGLSGGIDSALVATLAVEALGRDRVVGLLMPGPYSSRGSVVDALALADNLGIRFEQLAITRAYEVLLGELDTLTDGKPAGLAVENLQSRLRGTLVMAAANHLGAMALTTGNKSELATGYCTIYGDMNGGLAPIGDVYKTDIWRLSRHANALAAAAGRTPPIPESSITKVPSAELRPDQTDQDSLPPYEVLDRILRGYLEDGQSPDDLIRRGDDAATVRQVVRLVEVSEFKRRQSAPVLRLSRKAFGVGRRIPVARGF